MLQQDVTGSSTESPAAMRSGLLIVLEGGEGAGKTTQWQRLTTTLQGAGHDVVALREPGGTPAGDEIRRLLLDPASDLAPEAEALLFAASRAQLVHTIIRPALDRGAVVLVDRFLLSTFAYQGAGRGLSLEQLAQVNKLATGGLTPDATLLLTLPLSEAMTRMVSRGGTDRIEEAGLAFHERVQRAFVEAADPAWLARHPGVGPVYLIEASGSPEMVTVRCLERLAACFPTSFAGVMHG